MKPLVIALLLTGCTSALMAQPAGYSVPPSDPPPAEQADPGRPGRPVSLPTNANALQAAKAYSAEKSWQLAIQAADEGTTVGLSPDELRELAYVKAVAAQRLRRGDDAELFEQIIRDNPDDVWAGRAHWRLLTPFRGDTTATLNHLHAADRILTDLKSEDLREFYQSVIDGPLMNRRYDNSRDNNYILSFFDKIMPLLGEDKEAIARVLLRREAVLSIQTTRTQEQRLADWRGLVSTYPKTKAAATAQKNIAQYYSSKQEYTPALYELNLLLNLFPGTPEAKTAAAEIKQIKRAEAAFRLQGQYLPDEEVSFEIAIRNTSMIRLTARPFNYIEELKRQKSTDLDISKINTPIVVDKKVEVDRDENYGTTTRTLSLSVKRAGAYVLTAESGGQALCHGLLVVSNLALVGNSGPQAYELWAVDASTGKPRPGVQIVAAHNVKARKQWFSGNENSYFSDFKKLVSDSSGFADLKISSDQSGQFLAVATDGPNIAILDQTYWAARRNAEPAETSYIYTDRPVYRPEQKVYWRAVVRTEKDGQYSLEKNGKYLIEISDPQGQVVSKKEGATLSDFGTLEGELELRAGAALGPYSIRVQNTRTGSGSGYHTFRVEEYKKPEFLVSVNSATDLAKVGDTVKATVKADYLFGEPVTNAEVSYTVRRRMRFQTFWDFLPWYLDDLDLGWFEDKPRRPARLHGSGGVIVAKGTGRLDEKGEFSLEFRSTVPDDELKNSGPGMPLQPWYRMIWPPMGPPVWDFQVEVTVTDASRRNIDASQVIPVGRQALFLAARTQRHLVSPGDNARVELKSYNLAQKPVPTTGTLAVELLTWDESAKDDVVTTVSTEQVAVGTSGSKILTWRVPQDVRGRLRFAYIVDDPFGGKAITYANFASAAADDTNLAVQYQGVEIIADRTLYEVGDTARVMILNEYADTEAWFWVDGGSGNLVKKVVPLPHRTNFLSIPISDAFVPNSNVHIVAVRNKRVILDEVELIVPPTRQVIDVSITPDAATVEPGQPGRVVIHATDKAGNPVEGEFSLSIFDKAITYIAPDMREDIRRFFYGKRRALFSNVQQSLATAARYGGPANEDVPSLLEWEDPQHGSPHILTRRSGGEDVLMQADRVVGAPRMMTESVAFAADAAPAMAPPAAMKMEESALEEPAIRADFRDSLIWSPAVKTDAAGSATVEIRYPDSLTTWQMDAVGVTAETRVGNGTTETVAQKKILARLQTPRFLRERDQLTITGNLHNYTEAGIDARTTLTASGVSLDGGTATAKPGATASGTTVNIKAGGEARVDWKVRVPSAEAGEAVFTLAAASPAGGDAMQTTVPLLPHGIDKFVAWNGTSQDADTTTAQTITSGSARVVRRTVSLPAERIRETSRLDIHVNPSLAYAIRDALPYMINYPYKSVENTMSRFMPAMVAADAFKKLGYPLDKDLQERLPEVARESLENLRETQLPTGGWGWWPGDFENLPMTCYVVEGLTLATRAGLQDDPAMMRSGVARLAQMRDELTSTILSPDYQPPFQLYTFGNSGLHNLAYAEYVLTMNGEGSSRTLDLLFERRDNLSGRGLAMLARTLGAANRRPEADVVLRNMLNVATVTPENNTLRWGKPDQGWLWYEDSVEATAVGLMAYLELHPDDPAVDRALKWLVLNRQGARWKSTRDTALAVLAMTQYMVQKKELAAEGTVRVSVAGKPVKTLTLSRGDAWNFDGKIELRGAAIPEGDFPVELEIAANTKVYYSIFAEYFTREENIQPAGNEIYVSRTYEKLSSGETTETVNGQTVGTFEDHWTPLKEGETLSTGDEVRVSIKIKSLNDYEYIIVEDAKPAGFEPVDLQSGTRYGSGLASNVELRDSRVVFFLSRLMQGEHELQYRMRAEVPGTFHAMPTTGAGIYFPPLRANSAEQQVEVHD